MKCVLVISNSDLSRDHRVRRQIKLFADSENIRIITFALKESGIEDVFIPMNFRFNARVQKLLSALILIPRIYWVARKLDECKYRKQKREIRKFKPDLAIINDIDSISFGWGLAEKTIVDAHEYSPGQYSSWKFRLIFKGFMEYRAMYYFPRVNEVFTVCDSIAELYNKLTGVHPQTFRNVPYFHNLTPVDCGEGIRIVHHGGTNRNRYIERMILMMDHLPERYSLTLFLVSGDMGYIEYLQGLARTRKNVEISEPLPSDQVIRDTNTFDIGLYLLEPENINQKYALPNKVFEFIQSRLCLAISPGIEMARIVNDYKVGVTPSENTPEGMAHTILGISNDDLARYKANSHRAAEDLCYEHESLNFLAIANNLLQRDNKK